ncbi:ribosome small subunit-dependent GTPase A [Oscillospiraceae bacterium WX1]
MKEGVILKALSGFYTVADGEEACVCKARGRFRREQIIPLVGDRVEYSAAGDGTGVLENILPRRNTFVRPPVANIDRLVIITSAVIPVTDPYLVDRMTAIAALNDCEAIIVVNKCDIARGDSLYDIYSGAGFSTIRTSATTGEGIDALFNAVAGKVCAFTGNSGVGKSSILNALEPSFGLQVGDVSQKLGRGRHTTRHVELYKLRNGALIADTPGFSAFDTDLMRLDDEEQLQYLFQEFAPYLGRCRFTDCAHVSEPGCAVLEAVTNGLLHHSRHESYARLYELAKQKNDW